MSTSVDGGPRERLHLTLEGCKQRQELFRAEMARMELRTAIVSGRENIYYLSGYLAPPFLDTALLVEASGESVIFGQIAEKPLAVDRLVPFESQRLATLRLDQTAGICEAVRLELGGPRANLGADYARTPLQIASSSDVPIADLDPVFWRLRRQKHEDELVLIKKAVSITEACYRRAFEIIAPGISELDVFAELRKTAVLEAGEELTTFRTGDYQCGTPGGAPRPREARAGELYILDIGLAFRGYWADSCRTFAVDRALTSAQERAFERVEEALSFVESEARAGVSCRALYQEVANMLAEATPARFSHHLGHGFGLSVHERPKLNPHWDHHLAAGDCIAVEPGLYHETLSGGLRLEQNYVVTDTGTDRLTSFPLRSS